MLGGSGAASQSQSASSTIAMSVKPKCMVGDQALNDLVEEEYKQNAKEECERFKSAQVGSSWLGKVISNTFDYSGKSDFDF